MYRVGILFLSLAVCSAAPFGTPRTAKEIKGRTEITFDDESIIRAGAGARFQATPGTRIITLDKGSILFSSPKGAGGGLLRSGNVLVTTSSGDIQMSNVEGLVRVISLNGKAHVASTTSFTKTTNLKPGQMVTIPPGTTQIPDPQTINLQTLLSTSGLMSMGPLPSDQAIEKNARSQKGPPPIAVPGVNIDTAAQTTRTIAAVDEAKLAQQQAAAQAIENAALVEQRRLDRQQFEASQQAQNDLLAKQHATDKAAEEQSAQQANNASGNNGGNNGGGPQGNNGRGNQGNNGNQGNSKIPPGQAKKQ